MNYPTLADQTDQVFPAPAMPALVEHVQSSRKTLNPLCTMPYAFKELQNIAILENELPLYGTLK